MGLEGSSGANPLGDKQQIKKGQNIFGDGEQKLNSTFGFGFKHSNTPEGVKEFSYTGSLDYQGTTSGMVDYSGVANYGGQVEYTDAGSVDYSGTVDYSGQTGYSGSADYSTTGFHEYKTDYSHPELN